jgi:hypothetical protein
MADCLVDFKIQTGDQVRPYWNFVLNCSTVPSRSLQSEGGVDIRVVFGIN